MSDDNTHQVGCIDGSILEASRSPEGWTLRFGGAEAALSDDAANKLAAHLTSGSADAPPRADGPSSDHGLHDLPDDPRDAEEQPLGRDPASATSRPTDEKTGEADDDPQPPIFEVPSDRPHQPKRDSINDLIDAGLLSPGTILEATYKGEQYLAEVTHDGRLDVEGRLFESPTAAAQSVMSGKLNGWKYWRVLDGPGLMELRWRYRAGTFPEDADRLSEATVRRKQSRATRWLDFALTHNLDPGERDQSAIDRFLSDRDVTEGTVVSYRTHLDQWFHHCERNNW